MSHSDYEDSLSIKKKKSRKLRQPGRTNYAHVLSAIEVIKKHFAKTKQWEVGDIEIRVRRVEHDGYTEVVL